MLLCSRDPGYIRDDLTISTKPDHCILVVRLTSRLTSCTSQSRTRKLSESSPSSSTCSLSGALNGISVHQKNAQNILHLNSFGTMLSGLYLPIPALVRYFSPSTTFSCGRTPTLKQLFRKLRLLPCWMLMLRLNPEPCWQFCWAFKRRITDGVSCKNNPGSKHKYKSGPVGNNSPARFWRPSTKGGGAD